MDLPSRRHLAGRSRQITHGAGRSTKAADARRDRDGCDVMGARTEADAGAWLESGGEMGRLIAGFDWTPTPLGPIDQWPHSLRTIVQVMLDSRYAMWLGWGPELTFFYNDAYARMTLGPKHPWALGRPAREVWSEIWSDIGPRAESVIRTGQATWDEGLLLFLERRGFPEETYHTFSYSPVREDSGGIGGMLCVVTEDTERTIAERRLRTLRDLAARTSDEVRSADAACQTAARILGENPRDIAFALLYLLDADAGRRLSLSGAVGAPAGSAFSPLEVALDDDAPVWPFAPVAGSGTGLRVEDLSERFGNLPADAWPKGTDHALVLPLARSGQSALAGFLVAGLVPTRPFDDSYRDFLDLVAAHIATAIGNARAVEDERRKVEALAELNLAKTAFFSNVSHEFRTPLTLMLGPLGDVIADAQLPPTIRDRLEVVQRNSLRLLKLVNTLLDFSRIEAGRVEASYEPVDLSALTAELTSVFRSAIEHAGLKLIVDCPPLREPAYVDREMWEKIVFNLLSNAFKFTFDGEVAVSLQCDDDHARLSVRDTGTGIPSDQRRHVFERFHRVRDARGRSVEGSGIGLALVRELAKLHGGDIDVESEVGRGSTFRVSIPLGSSHLPAERVAAARATTSVGRRREAYVEEAVRWLPAGSSVRSRSSTARAPVADDSPRILLADDNADMREYVGRLLGERYRVEAVADGLSALDAARARVPDLVVSDVMMPGLDGFGLIGAMRADPRLQTVPVMLLSARAGEEARVEGMQAGADDYLVKPFAATELLARVEARLEIARIRRRAEDALREADRRKDEFLATLAHELRNPLAPLRSGLQVMQLAADRPEVVERARTMMERQLSHTVRLIDDLMDLSRISRGRIELRREHVSLNAIVQQAIETCLPAIREADHQLVVDVPDEAILVDADVTRLTQVFANLLNNAVKFTDRGGRIELTIERRDDRAVVRVKDDGIGIPSELLSSVFEMFTQADPSPQRARGGLGIGLSLVRTLVQLHGGSVEARSDGYGAGSEFIVRLPGAESSAVERPAAVAGTDPVGRRRRVLVVDDNRDVADSLAMMLTVMGNEVQSVYSAREALQVGSVFQPEAIVLDIGMPVVNGYDAARQIREQPWGESTFLIALTGWGQDKDRERSQQAGFDEHLVKPVEPARLKQVLDSLMPSAQ